MVATGTKAHIVAWFDSPGMAELLKSHCPQVESHTNITMELMVRSAQDPGSSRVQDQLLSTLEGPTQYSVQVPEGFASVNFLELMSFFKTEYEATVLGVADTVTGDDLMLNPPSHFQVKEKQVVYYMASERIHAHDIRWEDVNS